MIIHFGLNHDGMDWSDAPAALGELRLGPAGMTSFLQTRLGLDGADEHQAMRIDQYMARLERDDSSKAWQHASFATDPWSTAKQLLAWRDELVEAGWDGRSIASKSPRLKAIAHLEQSDIELAPAFADKQLRVLAELRLLDAANIAKITLSEPLDLLPALWRRIFAKLKEMGVRLETLSLQPSCHGKSDLAVMQHALATRESSQKSAKANPVLRKDESLLLVEADTEWEAAETLGLWLSAEPNANAGVALLVPESSSALSDAFRSLDLPIPGGGEASAWRAHLSILPLVLANAWEPADLGALIELLALPISPIPAFARKLLLRALDKEPGLGGDEWKKALGDIREKYTEFHKADGKADAAKKADELIGKLDAMLSTNRFPLREGISGKTIQERCQWVIASLAPRVKDHPHLVETLRQAEDIKRLVNGKGTVTKVALERMLDSVIGVGGSSPNAAAEASPWRLATHPGATPPACETLLWWNFTAAAEAKPTYWSRSERKDLHAAGVEVGEPGVTRRREAFAWRRAFFSASDRVLLFRPKQLRGEPAARHPFWDEIAAVAECIGGGDGAKDLIRDAGTLVAKGKWRLSDRRRMLDPAKEIPSPDIREEYKVKPGFIKTPETTSYSDMSDLIACPMKWVLHRHIRLFSPDAYSLPDANQSMGSIGHRIVQEILMDDTRKLTPAEAGKEAMRKYDSLARAMLLDFLAESREVENARNRKTMGEAMQRLADWVKKLGLRLEDAEFGLKRQLGDTEFYGLIDLFCRTGDGGLFIIDMKWTGSPKRYHDELVDGEAFQLAAYAWLLEGQSKFKGAGIDAAYYLLRQGRMLSGSVRLGDDRIETPHGLDGVFARAEHSWRAAIRDLENGRVEASGIKEQRYISENGLNEETFYKNRKSEVAEGGGLYRRPPCGYCDYAGLCGIYDESAVPAAVEDEA